MAFYGIQRGFVGIQSGRIGAGYQGSLGVKVFRFFSFQVFKGHIRHKSRHHNKAEEPKYEIGKDKLQIKRFPHGLFHLEFVADSPDRSNAPGTVVFDFFAETLNMNVYRSKSCSLVKT